jgi:tRNA(Ile)-lysidine synthetase-like protein
VTPRHPLVRRVARALRARALVEQGERVLVAVSGGADSVFALLSLAALARRFELRLEVAHLDHGWRGHEGAVDAAFVAALAVRLGIPCHQGVVDAPAFARRTRMSPEAAARRLRYEFLQRTCDVRSVGVVVTGHNADDQLETALMALLRGSGPGGVAAMPWRGPLPAAGGRAVRLIRPLLGLGRDEIRAGLCAARETWRDDESNLDRALLRNRVRLEVVPLLESIAPGFRAATLRSLHLTRQAHAFLQRHAAIAAAGLFSTPEAAPGTAPRRISAARRDLCRLEPELQGEVVRWAVGRLQGGVPDLEWAHVEGALDAIKRGRGGATAWLSSNVRLRLERGRVVVEEVARATDAADGLGRSGQAGGADSGRPAPSWEREDHQ